MFSGIGGFIAALVVVAAITLRHNQNVVPICSGNSLTTRTYVLVR